MKTIKLAALMTATLLAVTGCSATKGLFSKYDNGSLDYRDSAKLPPVKLPASQQAAVFVPLYQTPAVTGELPEYKNEAGRQYELPRPPSVLR